MNKQTKTILGVAAVGVAAYLVFKSMKSKTASFIPRPASGVKGVHPDLYVGNSVRSACEHKVKAPLAYMLVTPPLYGDSFNVGKRWFTNFEQQINYPNGYYSLYNPTNSLSGRWVIIANGVVTQTGSCGDVKPINKLTRNR